MNYTYEYKGAVLRPLRIKQFEPSIITPIPLLQFWQRCWIDAEVYTMILLVDLD